MNNKLRRDVIIVCLVTVSAAFLLFAAGDVCKCAVTLLGIFSPLWYGIAFGIILRRPALKLQTIFKVRLKLPKRMCAAASVAAVYAIILACAAVLVIFILPEAVQGASLLSDSFVLYRRNAERYAEYLRDIVPTAVADELMLLLRRLAEYLPALLSAAVSATGSFLSAAVDIVLGLIIAAYILSDYASAADFASHTMKKLLPKKQYLFARQLAVDTAEIFSDFVIGQLSEGVILGVLCFIGMNLLGLKYSLLISIVIAVSSVIPIIGAILGTVPSALILLLDKPSDAVVFVIFIILLQQLESNLIYPHVVGGRLGLPPVFVLLSVIVGGGLFGVAGILLSVPAAAVAYKYIAAEPTSAAVGDDSV